MLFDNFANKQVKNQGLKSSSVPAGPWSCRWPPRAARTLTRPQSSSRNARGGSRGWWEGKKEEDSLPRFPPSHHTPHATKERQRERRLGTSQGAPPPKKNPGSAPGTWLKHYWLLKKHQCMRNRKGIRERQRSLSFLSIFSYHEKPLLVLVGLWSIARE